MRRSSIRRCRRPAWRRAVEKQVPGRFGLGGQLGSGDGVEGTDDRGQRRTQLVAHDRNEVGLHLRDLLEAPGHLGDRLVTTELGKHQRRRGTQGGQGLELFVGEGAFDRVSHRDDAHLELFDLERCHHRLVEAEFAEHSVTLGLVGDLLEEHRLARLEHLGKHAAGAHRDRDVAGLERIAGDPDRVHDLQLVGFGDVEHHDPHLGIEVGADATHQFGQDLCQATRPRPELPRPHRDARSRRADVADRSGAGRSVELRTRTRDPSVRWPLPPRPPTESERPARRRRLNTVTDGGSAPWPPRR